MLIAGYVPCSLSDYPGCVAAVVFTQGCNWRCPWCHNKGLLALRPQPGALDAQEVLVRLERRRGKLDGVVVTGGEPTLQADLEPFLRKVRALGFRTKLDTNGSNPRILSRLLAEELLDFVAMDLKAPLPRYSEAAGVAVDTEAFRECLALLRGSRVPHHLRTTRWPGLGRDDFAEIEALSAGSPHVYQEYREPENALFLARSAGAASSRGAKAIGDRQGS